jgi:hypothetical protein
MMIGQSVTTTKSVQSALGRVNDQRQAMIVAQPVDQVHVRQAVVHQAIVRALNVRTVIGRVVMMIGHVPTGLIQIVHVVMMIGRAAMMIGRNVLVTKNQNVANGQANDLKQVMIADQLVDQVQVDQVQVDRAQADHQLADQVQIARTQIVHAAMMIVLAPTVPIPIARALIDQLQIAHALIDQVQIVRIPIDHVVMIAQTVSVEIVRASHAMIVAVMTVLVMIAHVVVVQIALVVGLLVMKMNVQLATSPKSELTLMTRLFPITLPVKNYREQCETNFVHCQMA